MRLLKGLKIGFIFTTVLVAISVIFGPFFDLFIEEFWKYIGISDDSFFVWAINHRFISLFFIGVFISFIYDLIYDIFEVRIKNIARKIEFEFVGMPTSQNFPLRLKVKNNSKFKINCHVILISLSLDGKEISNDFIPNPRFQWIGNKSSDEGERILDPNAPSSMVSILNLEHSSNKIILTLIAESKFRGDIGDYHLICEVRGEIKFYEMVRPFKPIRIQQNLIAKDIEINNKVVRVIRIAEKR